MKKINVLTYCDARSYGSVLQSYSLKRTLKKLGYESKIIETENSPNREYKVAFEGGINPKNILAYLLSKMTYKKSYRRISGVQKFMDENMDFEYHLDYDKLKNHFTDEDVFLAGSDQIFHPVKLWPPFFLDFAPEKARKLSYAASMGVLNVPSEKSGKFGEYINNFDCISVRENEMIPVLKKYTDKPIEVNIDPVFLTDRESWRKITKPYSVKKPYILVYAIYWNSNLNSQLKKLKKETNCDIIVVSNSYRNIYADKWIFDADLQEFLWLVDNAEAVVTSSFHGVAMSLIFNKRLSAVVNPSFPSRIDDLLDVVGYKNLAINELANNIQVDFKRINDNIKKEKEKSTDYLKRILS